MRFFVASFLLPFFAKINPYCFSFGKEIMRGVCFALSALFNAVPVSDCLRLFFSASEIHKKEATRSIQIFLTSIIKEMHTNLFNFVDAFFVVF